MNFSGRIKIWNEREEEGNTAEPGIKAWQKKTLGSSAQRRKKGGPKLFQKRG